MQLNIAACVLAASLLALPAFAGGIRIDEPQEGAVVNDVAGNLFVEAELGETEFAASMQFELLLDGKPVTRPSKVPVFNLRDIQPGRHRLEIRILDRDGKSMTTSEPVHFEMRRRAAAN